MINIRIAAFSMVMVFCLATAYADSGRTPVYGATVIDSPGHYYLTRNISSSSNPVISIEADDVTLDLNGFKITGASTAINFSGYVDITIKNGRLSAQNGVYYSSATRTRVVLESLEIRNTVGYPIYLNGLERAVIRNCDMRSSNGFGVCLNQGSGVLYSALIENNVIEGFLGYGLSVTNMDKGIVSHNVISEVGGAGALFHGIIIMAYTEAGGNVISDNVIRNILGGGDGIWISISANNTIARNVITEGGAAASGLMVDSSKNVIEQNDISEFGTGILIKSYYNALTKNRVIVNSNNGLLLSAVSSQNRYWDNAFYLNGATDVLDLGTANYDRGGNIN